ncbi:MAG TPA: methylated-DNA--[protein]-cysteine S-methyltransferase [Phototrophicaceae bacterium]|nr:methylated-DNA--[protein]-cysteine S-methyltransferase [Phototrophicaceae bacterium]
MSVELHTDLVARVCRFIESKPDCMPTLAEMGDHVGMSPFHLQRVFKKLTGVSPRDYAESCRVKRLKQSLREGQNVTTALYDAGYGSSSRLYERSAEQLGMTPSKYRKGGEGMIIGYTICDCNLGRLLVAMTVEGICCVHIADDDEALERHLFEEYPAADIQRSNPVMREWVEQFLAFLNGWQPHFDLPLDLRATAFQLRVWQTLLSIPYGETRSYREIAEAMGQPTAFRAVANACAANPVPLVVPCHRVIRSDGEIGGYGLGVERKRALLEQEHEIAQREHQA